MSKSIGKPRTRKWHTGTLAGKEMSYKVADKAGNGTVDFEGKQHKVNFNEIASTTLPNVLANPASDPFNQTKFNQTFP